MIYDSQSGDIKMALAGDALITRRFNMHREETFIGLAEIFRNADVGFFNLEGTVRTWDEGTPNPTNGINMTIPPAALEDIRWFGVNLVSCANNHAGEYGEGGILATVRHLEDAGIVGAGIGANLTRAASPGYLETAQGRIGLLSASSSFYPWRRASDQGNELHGRPGINALAWSKTHSVDPAVFEQLKRLNRELGYDKELTQVKSHTTQAIHFEEQTSEALSLFGNKIVNGGRFDVTTEVNKRDATENLRWIREAKKQSDWVIFSLHSHETSFATAMKAADLSEVEEPADFVVDFAHQAIDAGADVFVGHGRQIPYGIEIYKGRPIFYGLGCLFMEYETIRFFPKEKYQSFGLLADATPGDFADAFTGGGERAHAGHRNFWENVVVECSFAGGVFKEARLYPVDLGFGLPRSQRGRPVLAAAEAGRRVLERVQRISRRYGTEMVIADNVGVVRSG
ncbi:MAG TPA: CapA family protein [Beijerinckiaceae bacterium]|nr:CapA family protein [Beijerinckiaceae bacterium]